MKPDPVEVGQRIKKIRVEKGLSQKEFAKITDSTIPAISNWENGRNLPNKERLKSIADLAGIVVNEILHGEERDYVYSLVPTNDVEELELTYDLYISRYGEGSYRTKEDVLNVYEAAQKMNQSINERVNSSLIAIHSHLIRLLLTNLHKKMVESGASDDLEQMAFSATQESDALIHYVANSEIANTVSKSTVISYLEKNTSEYIKGGVEIDEELVNNYIKENFTE